MNAQPNLFSDSQNEVIESPYLYWWHLPKARVSDPTTSHEAAATVKPGNSDLIKAIRFTARVGIGIPAEPISAFDIARYIERDHPGRWSEASIRTACSRAGLRAVDTEGKSPRGQRCIRYSL